MNTHNTTIQIPSAAWLFLGALCYYAALPPLNIAALTLAVPICWGIVILAQERGGASPPVRWYWVYLVAFLFWLASIWWIACPHPLTSIGLLALAAYLSLYWVLFFVAARVAVHRFRIPLLVAMPVCWIGTEYWRCNVVLGGFSFCSLEHAFYLYPPLIQFASIGGSLLVGGIIMFVGAACLPLCVLCVSFVSFVVKKMNQKGLFINPVPGFIVLPCLFAILFIIISSAISAFLSALSSFQTGRAEPSDGRTEYSIVALQGDRQVRLNSTAEDNAATFQQYIDLTYQAAREKPDLIIWPETVCPYPLLVFAGTVSPADLDLTEEEAVAMEMEFRQFVQNIDTPVIFGLSTFVFKDNSEKPLRLNSALLIQPQRGEELSKIYRYDKMHLVMFGEYIPFAEYLPDDFILRTLCPEASAGDRVVAFPVGWAGQGSEVGRRPPGGDTTTAAVNICFESSVAPLVRRHVLELRQQGHDPRVLINISNVGWFWFSQQIEQHLATHVFRAVENRMWYVTAANGGFSAIISPMGKIESIGTRGAAEPVSGTVLVNLQKEHSLTFYQKYGDGYALLFGLITVGLAACALRKR
ncbi:MAG: apolipoprotein N-acyltransferase [Planctomycetaceae bacterium]|nr:apolipoprotein N-acyltransferase [Planctomycetaceae bacterium]